MALLDRLPGVGDKPAPDPTPVVVEQQVKARLTRGRKVMLKDAAKRRLCMRFERGDTFWDIDNAGKLWQQNKATNPDGTGKPRHRIRNTYNFIRPIVEDKVSSATQRIPAFEVDPSTTDPQARSAARLAQQIAAYGYDQWRLRDVAIDVNRLAIGHGGAGFAFPYFDTSIGPYVPVQDDNGDVSYQGIGDIRVRVFSGNQVYWEAGTKFNDSPWYAFEVAEDIDIVKTYPGYLGGALQPDASTSDIPTDQDGRDHMVMVTNYLERPCPKYPKGRWLVVANDRLIRPEQPYPMQDSDGTVLDEPCLHRLRYTHDPESDDDLGLTWQLIDAQRSAQDCANKLLEWKNRCLNPRMMAVIGSLLRPPDDQPGGVDYYKPIGGQTPQWEQPPQVPEALFRLMTEFRQMMKDIAAYEDVHADPNVAARTVQQVLEQSQARWQSYLADEAEWWSRLMRHCLLLVARYYTEPRLIRVRGLWATENIQDFRGAQIMGQATVNVNPGSLVYRSKQEIQNRIQWIAATFPGYLSPERALAALDDGTAETIVQTYELNEAKVNRIIAKIRDGSVMDMPTRDNIGPDGAPVIDPQTGAPEQVPTFMPDVQDDSKIWLQVFGDWMLTQDYEQLPPAMAAVAKTIFTGIKQQLSQQAQAEAAQQAAESQARGHENAAKPAAPVDQASMPALPAG